MTGIEDPESRMPMDPGQWTGDACLTRPLKLSTTAAFTGPGDARTAVAVFVGTTGADDDQAVEVRLLVRHGMFDANLERIGEGSFQIGIRARDRADEEIGLLADSLRWLADQLDAARREIHADA